MRESGHISDIWGTGGPFIGPDGRPHGRVTVQTEWPDIAVNPQNVLFSESIDIGIQSIRGYPIRWFQRADASQVELEVPNVTGIDIDRSIDQDAGSCRITLNNQQMNVNGVAPPTDVDAGNPGFYNPYRGESITSVARWGHAENNWNRLLVPNAILRTYQGYGGTDKTIAEALEDGNVLLTGIWIVDDLQMNSSGQLILSCRDTAKLLIEQFLFPPIVPYSKYPLIYKRYEFFNRKVTVASGVYTVDNAAPGTAIPGEKVVTVLDSDVAQWYGPGYHVYGHHSSHSIDNLSETYYLSVGNSRPERPFAVSFIEYGVDDQVNAVNVSTWKSGYTMYVSIMEDGIWQGEETIWYDFRPLLGTQANVQDTGANIKYVASFTVQDEAAREYLLPRLYLAERVRISFRNLQDSGLGQWQYRAGVREFKALVSQGLSTVADNQTSSITLAPIIRAAHFLRNRQDLNQFGYATVSTIGQLDVFGDLDDYAFVDGDGFDERDTETIAIHPTGNGYWVMTNTGRINAYGICQFYGSPFAIQEPIFDATSGHLKTTILVSTPSGNGYWVVAWDGTLYAYGDAEDFGNVAAPSGEFIFSGCRHPIGMGLYLLATNGTVITLGDAVWRGNYNKTVNVSNVFQTDATAEIAIDIATTHTGGGYWIMTTAGRVQQFGDARFWGEAEHVVISMTEYDRYYHILPSPDSKGYLLTDGDGKIIQCGTVEYFGAPVEGTEGQLRRPGNYLDYSDIIKDLLLWGGFFFKQSVGPNEAPPVYGNIESTGAFSKHPLPDEMFDKRPIIDAVNELKEAVGYIVFVDDEGAIRFHSPNWWGPGNFLYDGNHVEDVIEIDELNQLMAHEVNAGDESLRSRIIISSEDPTGGGSSTIFTEYIPNSARDLRGIEKPAMWINAAFMERTDQQIMAELIAMHIWFSKRLTNVRAAANPLIGIDDQVRVWERTTGETFLHYVRGVSTNMDLNSGSYTMNLTTHFLGEGDAWLVVNPDQEGDEDNNFFISEELFNFLNNSPSLRITQGGAYEGVFFE